MSGDLTLPSKWGCDNFGGRNVLELRDGTKTNSQAKVQDEIDLHNQEKKVVNASRMEMVQQT